MGYFSNGTEGAFYQEHFCSRCVNWRDMEDGRGFGCPIIDLHSLWNYTANKDETKAEALNHFIPRHGIDNAQCQMFQEAQPEKFKYCSKCDNATALSVEKIEGNLCVLCASKLEEKLINNGQGY